MSYQNTGFTNSDVSHISNVGTPKQKTSRKYASTLLLSLSALAFAACGGGGGGGGAASVQPTSTTPPPPPPTTTGTTSGAPTFVAGQFENEDNFKNKCEAPRNSTSVLSGRPFPDEEGSTLEEKFWLRSWSNNTYLWYNEITDIDPNSIADRVDYFNELRTFRTTASGNPVDQFHFTIPTDEYEQRVSSGASGGYGARFFIQSASPPRSIVVGYVEASGPAAAAGITRGDQILTVDGVDVANGADVDTLNNGLFPATVGETHTFEVRAPGATETRTVDVESAIVEADPVPQSTVLTRPNGDKVGYLVLNTFGTSLAEEEIVNAVTQLSNENISDLVLDLRYNGGGFLAISSQLSYMIAGQAATNGQTYETLVFNDKHPVTNPVTGETLSPTPFYSTTLGFSLDQGTQLPTLDLPRVFILSTADTCSASESLMNSLRGIDVEVVLVGTTTCGKPYGFYATDNCGETYFTVQFRGENAKGFGDYADGFSPASGGTPVGEAIPGCLVDDDFTKLRGDVEEDLLETALSYIDTGTCPATTASAKTEKPWGVALNEDLSQSLYSDPRIANLRALETAAIQTRENTRR